MPSGGGTQTSESTTNQTQSYSNVSKPWKEQIPYYRFLMDQAMGLYMGTPKVTGYSGGALTPQATGNLWEYSPLNPSVQKAATTTKTGTPVFNANTSANGAGASILGWTPGVATPRTRAGGGSSTSPFLYTYDPSLSFDANQAAQLRQGILWNQYANDPKRQQMLMWGLGGTVADGGIGSADEGSGAGAGGAGGASGGGGGGRGTALARKMLQSLYSQHLDRSPIYDYSQTQGGELEYYPGELIAGFTPDQLYAHGLIRDRVVNGDPTLDAAKQLMTGTLAGNYLSPDSNPWLKQTYDKAWSEVLPQYDLAASKYGAYGGSDYLNMRSKGAADLATEIYGGNYQLERNRQLEALGMYPSFQQAELVGPAMLENIGKQYQDWKQSWINAEKAKWEYEQMEPWKRLALLADFIGVPLGQQSAGTSTLQGTTTTSTTTPGSSPLGGILGGIGGILSMIPNPLAQAAGIGSQVLSGAIGGNFPFK